jgi:hypothetical protein
MNERNELERLYQRVFALSPIAEGCKTRLSPESDGEIIQNCSRNFQNFLGKSRRTSFFRDEPFDVQEAENKLDKQWFLQSK